MILILFYFIFNFIYIYFYYFIIKNFRMVPIGIGDLFLKIQMLDLYGIIIFLILYTVLF